MNLRNAQRSEELNTLEEMYSSSLITTEFIRLKLRRTTTSIVNHIGKTSSNSTRLVGIALEFISDALNPSDLILTGILGTKWDGCIPTWEVRKNIDTDSEILCELIKSLPMKSILPLQLAKGMLSGFVCLLN
jgi:hypothetical protein